MASLSVRDIQRTVHHCAQTELLLQTLGRLLFFSFPLRLPTFCFRFSVYLLLLWILANRQFRASRLKTVILYNPDLQPSSAFFKLISSISSLVKMSLHYYTCMGAESELCCAVASSAVVAVSLRDKWSRITDYFIPCLFLWNMWSCLKRLFRLKVSHFLFPSHEDDPAQ